MTNQVFNLHSTVEIPLDDLHDVVEALDLPSEIDSLTTTRRNSILVLESEAIDDVDIGQYTPTANLKATIEEKRPERPKPDGLWAQPEPEEEQEEIDPVTYAGFKGYGESVLYNNALQYPMFQILRQIALHEEATGTLTAIVLDDDGLRPVKIVDGEERDAEVAVVDTATDDAPDWVEQHS